MKFWKLLQLALGLCLVVATTTTVQAQGFFRREGHNAMVAQSGIRPAQIGTHEGVGMSTRGYEAARNIACYWGQRTPVSIQYSKRGPYYYAVVRYR